MGRISILFAVGLAFLGGACQQSQVDLEDIQSRGKLIALTSYNATSYFIYKGETMGYEYELLRLLADSLGLELEIAIVKGIEESFEKLNAGEGDLLASNVTVTKERAEKVAFTDHLMTTRQVLVQRKPENWRKMKLHEIDRMLIRNPIDLISKKIHVRKGSSYVPRLHNLSGEIGGDIEIIEMPADMPTEEIIKRVAEGEIEFTVADENVALINAAYYFNIDVETPISLPQQLAWAVRKNAPQLLGAINRWIEKMKKGTDYYVIYNKYFKNRRAYRKRFKSEFFSRTGGKISPYDDYVKERAQVIGWDWRLLASQIYQESQFDPHTRSWAGAVGVMQLLPNTAKQFGVSNLTNPLESIKGGTNYIKWLDDYWEDISNENERKKFILASYNVGQGHVKDAGRLASKYGKDPDVWDDNVAYYLLQKSRGEVYNDDVVKFGYCRGQEPVNYVEEILERFDHYSKFVD